MEQNQRLVGTGLQIAVRIVSNYNNLRVAVALVTTKDERFEINQDAFWRAIISDLHKICANIVIRGRRFKLKKKRRKAVWNVIKEKRLLSIKNTPVSKTHP